MRLVSTLLIVAGLSGCMLSKQYYNAGDFDSAVREATYQLRKNPKQDKQILLLEKACSAANQLDFNRIEQLKKEGNPNNWTSIYKLYSAINSRQQTVQTILPLFIRKDFRNADIAIVDVTPQMADAKFHAAEYMYAEANRLLGTGIKKDARVAFEKYTDLLSLCGDYKDCKDKIREAEKNGIINIEVKTTVNAKLILPEEFASNITTINSGTLNEKWLSFSNIKSSANDWIIENNISRVDLTPERVSDNTYREQTTVQDGWIYQLDKKGNVMKDTAGNDIKRPKMLPIEARITETRQNKSCIVNGEYRFILANGQVFKTIPYTESIVFDNYFAHYTGDKRAITPATFKKLGGQFIPFPSDAKMLNDLAANIQLRTQQTIRSNKQMLLQ